jgi:hypothetical protein
MTRMNLVIALFSCFIGISASAQMVTENLSEWKLYSEQSGLQIFMKEIGCHDNQNGLHEKYQVFQFTNTTQQVMEVTWQKELWYNNVCTTCNKPANAENTYNLELAPEESQQGSCDMAHNKGLKIFCTFIGSSKAGVLSKFEFKNLAVTFN